MVFFGYLLCLVLFSYHYDFRMADSFFVSANKRPAPDNYHREISNSYDNGYDSGLGSKPPSKLQSASVRLVLSRPCISYFAILFGFRRILWSPIFTYNISELNFVFVHRKVVTDQPPCKKLYLYPLKAGWTKVCCFMKISELLVEMALFHSYLSACGISFLTTKRKYPSHVIRSPLHYVLLWSEIKSDLVHLSFTTNLFASFSSTCNYYLSAVIILSYGLLVIYYRFS